MKSINYTNGYAHDTVKMFEQQDISWNFHESISRLLRRGRKNVVHKRF